jgi:hypothetical protein
LGRRETQRLYIEKINKDKKYKMKKVIIILVVVFMAMNAYCQNIFISGNGQDIKGKTIRLAIVKDRLSMLEKDVDETVLGKEDTSFNFSLTLSSPTEVIIKVDLFDYRFIAKPGQKYNLHILPFNFTKDDSLAAFTYNFSLPIELKQETDDGINNAMLAFDTTLDDFLYNNHRLLFIKDSNAMDSLWMLLYKFGSTTTKGTYAELYYSYEVAQVAYGLNLMSRMKIKDSLFANSPILYSNVGYMDCFKTVFGQYFSQGYKYIKREDLEYWLRTNNYAALSDALGRDKVLKNEVFRELVFLQGMRDAYLEGQFNKDNIINMIIKFENQTKFPEHKEIAKNLIEYLMNKSFVGKQSKDFKVKDVDGNMVSLKKYMGKPLILNFVRLDDVASLRELETIHYYYDSIKMNCNILTICCDNSFEKMYNFLKNNKIGSKYQWNFAYFNANYPMIEEYKVRLFPTFILIGENGKIESNPMEEPSCGGLIKFKTKNEK